MQLGRRCGWGRVGLEGRDFGPFAEGATCRPPVVAPVMLTGGEGEDEEEEEGEADLE